MILPIGLFGHSKPLFGEDTEMKNYVKEKQTPPLTRGRSTRADHGANRAGSGGDQRAYAGEEYGSSSGEDPGTAEGNARADG